MKRRATGDVNLLMNRSASSDVNLFMKRRATGELNYEAYVEPVVTWTYLWSVELQVEIRELTYDKPTQGTVTYEA